MAVSRILFRIHVVNLSGSEKSLIADVSVLDHLPGRIVGRSGAKVLYTPLTWSGARLRMRTPSAEWPCEYAKGLGGRRTSTRPGCSGSAYG